MSVIATSLPALTNEDIATSALLRHSGALSFIAQRFDRIQLGGAVGGVVAEENAHDNGEEAADQGDGLGNLDLPMQSVLKKKRPGKAGRHSQYSAEDTDDHGFAQELQADRILGGAD